MEELKGKLREEAEARASAADELEKAKAELKIIRTRAENAERDRDSAQAEIASLRERLTQLESREDEKERTIASLQREAEKIRIRAPKKKMEGEKMERLQDRKTDYTSTKSLREGADHIPASPPLATRSRTPSTEEDKRVTRMERSLSIGSGVDKPRVEKEPSVPEGELPKEKGRAIRRKTAAPSVHRQTQRSAEQPGAKDSGVGADSDAENESESEASPAVEETAREMRPSLTKQELPPKSKVEAAHPAITGTPSAVAVVQEELVYPPTQQAEESPSDAKEPHPESHEEQQAPQKKTEEMAEEEDYYIDSRHLTDKHKKRRDVEREIVDRLRQKYEGKNTLVGLENEAIMTLLSDSRYVESLSDAHGFSPITSFTQGCHLAQLPPLPALRAGARLRVGRTRAVLRDLLLPMLLEPTVGTGLPTRAASSISSHRVRSCITVRCCRRRSRRPRAARPNQTIPWASL